MRLFVGYPELPAADFRADLLTAGEIGFVRDPKLQRRFTDPLALAALDVDASS